MKKLLGKLSRVAAAGLLATACATVVVPEAEAMWYDFRQPPQTVNSGEANACGGDACVEKIGDTAKVKMRVQVQPVMLTSSDDSRTIGGAGVFVPKMLKNPTFTLVSTSNPESDKTNPDMPLPRPVALHNKVIPVKGSNDSYPPRDWLKVDPDTGKHVITAQPYLDKTDAVDNGLGFSEMNNQNLKDYDLYSLPVTTFHTIMTVDIEGDLAVTEEDMYVPIRVLEATWHCIDGVCESFKSYGFNEIGMLPPAHEGIPQSEKDYMASMNTPDGLGGYGRCNVTRDGNLANGGYLDRILEDINSPGMSPADKYIAENKARLGMSSTFLITGLNVPEDGCDTAAFHVTICDAALTETPTPTPTGTPEVITSTVKETLTPEKVTETVTVTPEPVEKVTTSTVVTTANGIPTTETKTDTTTVTPEPVVTTVVKEPTPVVSEPQPVPSKEPVLTPEPVKGSTPAPIESTPTAAPVKVTAPAPVVEAAPAPVAEVAPVAHPAPRKVVLATTGAQALAIAAGALALTALAGLALFLRRKREQ